MAQQDDLSLRFGSSAARAVHESGDERSARDLGRSARPDGRSARMASSAGAEHDVETTALRDGCAARTNFENRRTEHSLRAEAAMLVLRPLRKIRSALSDEFDGAMERLGRTNVAIAGVCGVTEKSVRQWRGRDLLPGEVAKPIPSDMLVHLPDDLFMEMLAALRGLRVVERQASRAAGGSR